MKASKKLIVSITLLVVLAGAIYFGILSFYNGGSSSAEKKAVTRTNGILILGDNHLNTSLGQKIIDGILKNQIADKKSIYFYEADESSFYNWLKSDFKDLEGGFLIPLENGPSIRGSLKKDSQKIHPLRVLISELKPKTIIISLGLYDFLQSSATDDKEFTESKKRILEIRGALDQLLKSTIVKKCIWIAPLLPPKIARTNEKQKAFFSELKYAVQSTKCNYVESESLEFDFSKNAGDEDKKFQQWREKTVEKILRIAKQ